MNKNMPFLKQRFLFLLLIWLFMFTGCELTLAGSQPETKNIGQQLAASCPEMKDSCIQKELEGFWKKANVRGKYDICRYLYPVDGSLPDLFLTTKLTTSLDPIVKGVVVDFLVLRHRQSNLPALIRLLTDSSVSSREGDTVGCIVLGDFQATIPIEYRFDGHKFETESSYRLLIQDIYETWYCIVSRMGKLDYNKRDKVFAIDESSAEMLRKHQVWFIQGCKSGPEPFELLQRLREQWKKLGGHKRNL